MKKQKFLVIKNKKYSAKYLKTEEKYRGLCKKYQMKKRS